MYKVSIPIMVKENANYEKSLEAVKKMGAERVFLAIGIISFDKEKRQKCLENLKSAIDFFKKTDLEIGVWLWAFWRSDLEKMPVEMEKITSFDGKTADISAGCEPTGNISAAFFCPSDKNFRKDTCDFLKQVAALNPDIIMFDDDFRYGNLPTGFGCCCKNHLVLMSEELGEEVTRENLEEKLFCGSSNRYRKAWLNALGNAMKDYARQAREAIDEINPNIRIAPCACMSLFDLDGVDVFTIAEILAGNTKPIIRLIGAPYWAVERSYGMRLQNIIELERMESAWCNNPNIEIMAEGDAYPRPRHACPSSFLEGFDTAIRAADITTGILKYPLSYVSSVDYEMGYVDAHLRNQKIYTHIEKIFKDKTDCGVRIFENLNKVEYADLPENYVGNDYMQNLFFSPAAKMLSDNTIPTNYTLENTVSVAFGENAKYIPDSALNNGLILDVKAAKILMDKGIDIGLQNIGDVVENAPMLYYKNINEYTESRYGENSVYEIIPKNNAEIISTFGIKGDEYPDSIFYQNQNGQKFLVFAFDAYSTPPERYRSYAMQSLLYKYIDLLGKPLAAKCKGNPDLYILCKEDENSLSIGLWNFFPDAAQTPVIELADDFKKAQFINCKGKLKNGKITLSRIPAFEFAFVKLTK